MNLEKVISNSEIADLIDPETIPNPEEDPYAYEFFLSTVELLREDKERNKENKEKGYVELGKIQMQSFSSFPAALAFHEYLHALGAELVGAKVYGFASDSWSIYTLISGSPFQVAFSSLFPHLVALPAAYYVSKKNWFAVPFLAPTLTELIPSEVIGYHSDFYVAAENIAPQYALPLKYLMLAVWYIPIYFIFRRNLKKQKK